MTMMKLYCSPCAPADWDVAYAVHVLRCRQTTCASFAWDRPKLWVENFAHTFIACTVIYLLSIS